MHSITLAIPAYNRNRETRELLQSILDADALPDEVLLSENCSPEREALSETAAFFKTRFEAVGVKFSYFENETNLGYDGNARSLFRRASSDWVLLMGNDDLLRKIGVMPLRKFLAAHPSVRFSTCAVEQFRGSTGRVFHLTRHYRGDTVETSNPACVYRLSSFIGGICIDRKWAVSVETDRFDGGLFYQLYLAAMAFTDGGLGYVDAPMVGGRSEGSPVFGLADAEKKFHVPGRFPAASRAKMYASILEITRYVDAVRGSALTPGVLAELDSRQLFHVYEAFVGGPRSEVRELYSELRKVGLGRSWTHKALYGTAYHLAPLAPLLFRLAREIRNRG